MEPFTLILAALLAQTSAAQTPPPPPPPPPGIGMMQADANHDRVVTRAEAIARADADFARMDADHDGKVTRDERRAAMVAARPGLPMRDGPRGRGPDRDMTLAENRERAAARFDRIDANHDGRIDAAELTATRTRMQERTRGGDAMPPPPGE